MTATDSRQHCWRLGASCRCRNGRWQNALARTACQSPPAAWCCRASRPGSGDHQVDQLRATAGSCRAPLGNEAAGQCLWVEFRAPTRSRPRPRDRHTRATLPKGDGRRPRPGWHRATIDANSTRSTLQRLRSVEMTYQIRIGLCCAGHRTWMREPRPTTRSVTLFPYGYQEEARARDNHRAGPVGPAAPTSHRQVR